MAVWGLSFIATKIALRELSPLTLIWSRFGIGLLILGGAVLLRREFKWVKGKDLWYFVALGFLGIAFHQWLQSTGLQTSEASTTAWIVSTTPIFIALLGRVFLKEKLRPIQIFGILLAVVGVLLVLAKGHFKGLRVVTFGAPGDWLILISAVNWAVFSVWSRRGLKKHPAAFMMLYVMASGWMILTFLCFASADLTQFARLSKHGLLALGFLGIFCSGFAYIFWYDALKHIPASQVGVFLYLEPLVAVAAAGKILGERMTPAAWIGGIAILVGVWLVNLPSLRKEIQT